jgi:hypothetical protein
MSEPNSPDVPAVNAASDPLDELLRGTMRALEAQTPAGYFEALPQAIDAAIDAGAGLGEEDLELAAEAGGRARRGSSQGPELRDVREQRKTPSTSIPPIASSGRVEGEPARAKRPTDSRAYRRSLLETQVGAPHPWWQTRAAALAVLGVALAAAIALVVLRRGEGAPSEERLGASSSRLHEPQRPAVRVMAPPDAAPPLTAEQVQLRDQLAGALPAARACVGARPLEEVELSITLEASGAVAAVVVRGAAAAMAAQACIADAVRAAAAGGAIGAGAARTVAIPLFD